MDEEELCLLRHFPVLNVNPPNGKKNTMHHVGARARDQLKGAGGDIARKGKGGAVRRRAQRQRGQGEASRAKAKGAGGGVARKGEGCGVCVVLCGVFWVVYFGCVCVVCCVCLCSFVWCMCSFVWCILCVFV